MNKEQVSTMCGGKKTEGSQPHGALDYPLPCCRTRTEPNKLSDVKKHDFASPERARFDAKNSMVNISVRARVPNNHERVSSDSDERIIDLKVFVWVGGLHKHLADLTQKNTTISRIDVTTPWEGA